VGVVLGGNSGVPRHLLDRVHLAGHARVVEHHDGLRPRRDLPSQLGFVEVQRVRTHVQEGRSAAAERKGAGRGNEGERGDDELVARPDLEQQGAHLEGVCGGWGQQDSLDAEQ
jgi:hypothetical protein